MYRRIVIAAPSSGAGKTTATMALMAYYKRQRKVVQGFKVGPDYIDPSFHRAITERDSWNLDPWMESPSGVVERFRAVARGADLSIIEGAMGLFDGKNGDSDEASAADLARLLEAPVLLVVDVSAMARSAAAMVLGFQAMDKAIKIAGVICNRVGSPGHYQMVKDAIESVTHIPAVGYIARDSELRVPERQLGLTRMASHAMGSYTDTILAKTGETLDFEAIWQIAENAPDLKTPWIVQPRRRSIPKGRRPVVAIADDEAFWFYYPANLALLKELKVELIPFSPLRGEELPLNATHLYWGGGFPEDHLKALSAHQTVLSSYRQRIQDGLLTWAECGGFMALSHAIWGSDQKRYPMAGVIPTEIQMTERLSALGYRTIEVAADSVRLSPGTLFRGHEFHYSRLKAPISESFAYRLTASQGSTPDGYATPTLLAGYAHLYFPSNPEAIRQWLYGERRD